jgi:glycerol-3-phosphate cytidylyltransferase-like family protein
MKGKMSAQDRKKVMAFGTFDIFHKGHENFLQQAKKCGLPADAGRGQGDFLVVVVARDETVQKVKKHKTKNDERKRLLVIKNSNLADKVILGNLGDKYAVIKKYKPDVIALGYDQKSFTGELKEKLKALGLDKTRIIRLKSYYPKKYKSSLL